MASFKTREEFIAFVLDDLGVLVPGQAPANEIVAKVDTRLDAVLAELRADDIFEVSNPGTADPPNGGEYDLSIVNSLSAVVADRVKGAFNASADAAIKAEAVIAEKRLRRIGKPERTRKFLRTDVQLRGGRGRIFNFITGR